MKAITVVSAVLTLPSLIAFDARPAVAEIYRPWCVQYLGGNGDNGTSCAFTSRE